MSALSRICSVFAAALIAAHVYIPCLNVSAGNSADYLTYASQSSPVYTDECFMRSSFNGCSHLELLSAQAAAASDTAHNITDTLEKAGFSNVSVNRYYNSLSKANSCAAAVGHKTIQQGEKRFTLIAVIPRSSGYQQEWAGNFNIGSGNIHEGFLAARDETLRFVKQYISNNNIKGDLKLWTAGHSRGGAVAGMTAAFFADGGIGYLGSELSITPEDVYCYTFASPGNVKQGADKKALMSVSGNRAEADYTYDTPGKPYVSAQTGIADPKDVKYSGIRNIISDDDLFPMLPPAVWGFTRFGNDLQADRSAQATESMLKELEKTDPELYSLYADEKGADSFRRLTFDLRSLSLVTDTKPHTANTPGCFLKERISGLAKAAGTNEIYNDTGCQEALSAAAGLFGMTADVIAENETDISSGVFKPLLYSYLAYASEQLRSEGKAADEAEAAAIAAEELLGYFTGSDIDHSRFTYDDFILLLAGYITENEGEPVAEAVISGIEAMIPEESRSSLESILRIFITDNGSGNDFTFSEGISAMLKACVYGPEPGCAAASSTDDPIEIRGLTALMLKNIIPELQTILFRDRLTYDPDRSFTDFVGGILPVLLSARDDNGTVVRTYPDIASLADDSLRSMLTDIIDDVISCGAAIYGSGYLSDARKQLDTVSDNISRLRELASYALFYSDSGFDTAGNIENLCTFIGNIRSISLTHDSKVYLAFEKASGSYDTGYSDHTVRSAEKADPASTTTTTAAAVAGKQTAAANALSSPNTGDNGAALPLALASAVTLVLSRKQRRSAPDQ